MKKINLSDIKTTEIARLAPGPHIAVITSAEDREDREYLQLEYDINGYWADFKEKFGFAANRFYRSYKESQLSNFKSFVEAVESSNPGYKFEFDEYTLVGKRIGVVLQEEEYINKSGDIKTRLTVYRVCPIGQLDSQPTPPLKKLKEEPGSTSGGIDLSSIEDLPFK